MRGPYQAAAATAAATADGLADVSDIVKDGCRNDVLQLFPDIDPAHMTALCDESRWDSHQVIQYILDDLEQGNPYPKPPRASLKRKREDDQPAAITPASAAKKWDTVERRAQFKDPRSTYTRTSHYCLAQFFPQLYVENLKAALSVNGGILFPTFLVLSQAVATGVDNPHTQRKKARSSKGLPALARDLDQRIQECQDLGECEAYKELRDARAVVEIKNAEAAEQRRQELEEEKNYEAAKTTGSVADCGCCYVSYATNRMVHCDGEEIHFFCRSCARTNAETQIGMAKYKLDCMSSDGDGCPGGFSRSQRLIFLDSKLQTALEQIEMDANIRASGIENIETCPFCSYAAEYPDLEVDREFRCLRDDCGIVSCRACRRETHIPKTCEEAALELGHSARHGIEEAMSEALIRKCNKCSTPFIKEVGCNKMTCTKCGNIQCYVCSKSCDYSHFNDARRGGRLGNCELFDQAEGGVEARHLKEVNAAEEAARKKVQDKFKGLDPELLTFKESDKVKEDQARRVQGGLAGQVGFHAYIPIADGAYARNYARRQRAQNFQLHPPQPQLEAAPQVALGRHPVQLRVEAAWGAHFADQLAQGADANALDARQPRREERNLIQNEILAQQNEQQEQLQQQQRQQLQLLQLQLQLQLQQQQQQKRKQQLEQETQQRQQRAIDDVARYEAELVVERERNRSHRHAFANQRGMEPGHLIARFDEGAANQGGVDGAVMPEFRPAQQLLDPLTLLPPLQMRGILPRAVPGQGPGAQANQAEANHEPPSPITPQLEQRRGDRQDPISLIFPAQSNMIDLTADESELDGLAKYPDERLWAWADDEDACHGDDAFNAWDM